MPAPKGPWDVPLKEYVKEFKLVILVHNLDNDTILYNHTINYSEPDERRWLGRVSYWATNNGYSVETMSEKDYIDKVR